MSNEEQHRLLCEALSKCVEVLDCDELSLIAHCCGVKISDFYGSSDEVETVEIIDWKHKEAA